MILILGIGNASRLTGNKYATCKKGKAQTIKSVTADLSKERLDASTAFTTVGVDYFGIFTVTMFSVYMPDYEIGAIRSRTDIRQKCLS